MAENDAEQVDTTKQPDTPTSPSELDAPKETPKTTTAELRTVLDQVQAAETYAKAHPKETAQIKSLIVQAVLAFYRLPITRTLEGFWNERSTTGKEALTGRGLAGKAVGLVGGTPTQAMQSLSMEFVRAGIFEPIEGMDLDGEAATTSTVLHTIDKTSPIWSQFVLLFGPEAEAAVPIIVSIVKALTFLNDNYQDVMKDSRRAVAIERADIQRSLEAADKLGAEPVPFLEGETHTRVEQDTQT
ncbi:MAG: hypothetical protein WCT46_04000 [Candidatus Gracilibacteria bacterium]